MRVNKKKRNRSGDHDDFLLNCNIGCKKHTTNFVLIASRFSQALFQKTYEQIVFLILGRSLELDKKHTFETCQSSESRFLFASSNLNIIFQK